MCSIIEITKTNGEITMKKFILESAAILALVVTLGTVAEASELKKTKDLRVLGEVGVINGNVTGGVSVKRNKYTVDLHVGKGTKSVGVARELLTLDKLSLGAGLSANKSETVKGSLKKVRTYQGYDLNIEYKFDNKMSIRGNINSNGDVKAGFGWSF